MYVVYDTGSGYSDESMRFATTREADAWIDAHEDFDRGLVYAFRVEA